jgi:hypothetical protein
LKYTFELLKFRFFIRFIEKKNPPHNSTKKSCPYLENITVQKNCISMVQFRAIVNLLANCNIGNKIKRESFIGM